MWLQEAQSNFEDGRCPETRAGTRGQQTLQIKVMR